MTDYPSMKTSAFASIALSLVILGFSAIGVQGQPVTACTASGDYLLTVTNPQTADRQLIMDLIHRYFWSLDDRTTIELDDMLLDGVTYELCNGAGQQLEISDNRQELKNYLTEHFTASRQSQFRTRHIESNTLLNSVDVDTVQGKTTVLVTLQFSSIEMPVVDYTATLRTTFRRDSNAWKFAKMVLITDSANVRLRAR
ncbi:nuclear transport factor 2 family protein [Rhizobium leguminosarum]|uniref:SnoaL-like domain family protein n=1 Tax=Rhizobium leguminosarum TaxID=384 RepID=A0A2Z4YTR3_RHILE|nr:nuclear transport factor 2 family protein [Rhizobium leguminosarum]AXA44804.1 SnoaL-like domain family protein [Rhizobium leguminosarum]